MILISFQQWEIYCYALFGSLEANIKPLGPGIVFLSFYIIFEVIEVVDLILCCCFIHYYNIVVCFCVYACMIQMLALWGDIHWYVLVFSYLVGNVGPPLAIVKMQPHSSSPFCMMAFILLVDITQVMTSNLLLAALDHSVNFLSLFFFPSKGVSASLTPLNGSNLDVGILASPTPPTLDLCNATTP